MRVVVSYLAASHLKRPNATTSPRTAQEARHRASPPTNLQPTTQIKPHTLFPLQGKKNKAGMDVDVTTNFHHYGTQGRLAGLIAMDMHNRQFRQQGMEGVSNGGREAIVSKMDCACSFV
jgi:hypothetical protein